MKKCILLVLCLMAILSSCKTNTNQNKTIVLKSSQPEKITLPCSIKSIVLETTQESQMGMVLKTLIDIPNNRIFILADFNLFIFDKEGKFLHKLKQGKGPNEVIRIPSFAINTEKKLIYAVDMSSSIVVLDYNGTVVERLKLNNFTCSDVFCLDTSNLMLLSNWVGRKENEFIGIYNLASQRIEEKLIDSKESPYPINTLITSKNFSEWNNDLYFYTANVFGLFKYERGNFNKIVSFDLNTYTVPKEFYIQFAEQNRSIFREEAKRKGYIPFILFAFPFHEYFLIGVDNESKDCFAASKVDFSKVYLSGSLASYFNLPNVKSLGSPTGLQKNTILFSCNPTDFFEHDQEQETKLIAIGDKKIPVTYQQNPILILITQDEQ